nr:uncharacterized protein LOC112802385 [Arachis hypogaea]
MYACNYQSLDRDYFAPLSNPPLKFVFFSSLGHLLRVVFFEKEVMEAVTHTYTETYTSHLRQKIRKETKEEKKIFAEYYGLKEDPRLLAISQAIRVVSQIYVPIKEEGDRWYMVISLLDEKLYQFDSNLNDDQVELR